MAPLVGSPSYQTCSGPTDTAATPSDISKQQNMMGIFQSTMLLKHTILATRQALTNFQFYLKNSSSKTCNNSKNNRKKKTKPSKEHDTERKRWRWRETNLGFLQRSLKLLIAGKHDPPHSITVGLVGLPLGGLPWGPQPRALPPVFCLRTDTACLSDFSPINKKLQDC